MTEFRIPEVDNRELFGFSIKKVPVNFDIMHKHYWREVSIKFKPTENIEILPGKPGNVINIFQ